MVNGFIRIFSNNRLVTPRSIRTGPPALHPHPHIRTHKNMRTHADTHTQLFSTKEPTGKSALAHLCLLALSLRQAREGGPQPDTNLD